MSKPAHTPQARYPWRETSPAVGIVFYMAGKSRWSKIFHTLILTTYKWAVVCQSPTPMKSIMNPPTLITNPSCTRKASSQSLIIALLVLTGPLLKADLRLGPLFQDSMIVQRDKAIAVWRWDTPKQLIRITLADNSTETVAYYYARDLHSILDVPAGIINIGWGGTRIEAWMDPETARADNGEPFAAIYEAWDDVLAGKDKIFHPAEARVRGNTVFVSSPDVPAPVSVRYAWSNAPNAGLFNGYDLPAEPFRKDDWDQE